MHKILVLYPSPQDESKFRPYYETKHMDLVAKMPGIQGYRYSFNIAAAPGEPSPYYCIFEADFADEAAMAAATSSPQGVAVREDAPNFSTTAPTVVHYEVEG